MADPIFDDQTLESQQSLIATQISVNDPTAAQLQTASGALIPDKVLRSRMEHFPSDLYDLRDQSHLVRFMAALIDAPGAGQLRRRYLMSRIQSVITGANFYDLDGFYGAIFNMARRYDEILPSNPMTDVETPDQWDVISGIDATYRERIVQLAAAIPLAGTVAGIKQAAEALVGTDVEVYEAWKSIDANTGLVGTTLTWDEVESSYGVWSAIEGTQWSRVAGTGAIIGLTGVNSRDEIIVRPLKEYDRSTQAGVDAVVSDEVFLRHVLDILRPAGTVISVDTSGILTYNRLPLSFLDSDSIFWEVSSRVTPSRVIVRSAVDPYPLSKSQIARGEVWGDSRVIPTPAFTYSQGIIWDYANDVSTTKAYGIAVDDPEDVSAVGENEYLTDALNYEMLPYRDGSGTAFTSERGLADPLATQGGTMMGGGFMGASVYSGLREDVQGR